MTMDISAEVKLITINYKQKWLLLIHVVKKSSEHLNIILDDLILLLFKRSHYVVVQEGKMAWAVMYRAINSL